MQSQPIAKRIVILLIALTPVLAACGVFGGDEETDETTTPTEEASETQETTEEATEESDAATPEETPDSEGTPDSDETAEADETEEESEPSTGTPTPDAEANPVEAGEQIFSSTCAACHQPEGEGVEGIYPALNGNALVTADDPSTIIEVILTGRGGMPRFADAYSNAEIAGIASYIRTAWDNDASEVSPEDVQNVRDSLGEDTEEEGRDSEQGNESEQDEATPTEEATEESN